MPFADGKSSSLCLAYVNRLILRPAEALLTAAKRMHATQTANGISRLDLYHVHEERINKLTRCVIPCNQANVTIRY